jgi:hypothetical protein
LSYPLTQTYTAFATVGKQSFYGFNPENSKHSAEQDLDIVAPKGINPKTGEARCQMRSGAAPASTLQLLGAAGVSNPQLQPQNSRSHFVAWG